MAEIDEIAGEKQRRSIVVETALKEYVAREKRKQKAKPEAAAVKEKATAGRR